jgi:hypothetical protein
MIPTPPWNSSTRRLALDPDPIYVRGSESGPHGCSTPPDEAACAAVAPGRRRPSSARGSPVAGVESKLTLVSAPPGFGKSTLVGDWLAARGSQAASAWLSLDSEDNDPATFWTYVVAALQTAAPNIGTAALSVLESAQPQAELALRALLNDLAALPNDVVLVLDDYHVIDRAEVHDGVAFVLDRLPPTVHVS